MATNRQVRNNAALVAKYMKEPKVKVLGSTLFKEFEGNTYSYTFNGFPVSIKFDGTYQEYPATIAKNLEAKLQKIAEANAAKKQNTKVYV